MRRGQTRLLVLFESICTVLCASSTRSGLTCACDRTRLQGNRSREILGFSVRRQQDYDSSYDFSQLTTVAWNTDSSLVCVAHRHGARVVLNADVQDLRLFEEVAARAAWIQPLVQLATDRCLDGINFDFEGPIPAGDPLALVYTALVGETATAFHAAIPESQVSVDVAWSPHGIDGRWFDWRGLAAAADLLFVMGYDTQSQIWGDCKAKANSPLALIRSGVEQYLALGIPSSKLILGVPWYGYLYQCERVVGRTCFIQPEPFRGAPCSDAAGREIDYAEVVRLLETSTTGRLWDQDGASSPYFNTADDDSAVQQIRYDDPESLRLKFQMAGQLDLRGVGVWNVDALPAGRSEVQQAQKAAMWRAFTAFAEATAVA